MQRATTACRSAACFQESRRAPGARQRASGGALSGSRKPAVQQQRQGMSAAGRSATASAAAAGNETAAAAAPGGGAAALKEQQCTLCTSLVATTVKGMLAEAQEAVANGADIVELRLDYLESFAPEADLPRLLQQCPVPAIATYRPVWEG